MTYNGYSRRSLLNKPLVLTSITSTLPTAAMSLYITPPRAYESCDTRAKMNSTEYEKIDNDTAALAVEDAPSMTADVSTPPTAVIHHNDPQSTEEGKHDHPKEDWRCTHLICATLVGVLAQTFVMV